MSTTIQVIQLFVEGCIANAETTLHRELAGHIQAMQK